MIKEGRLTISAGFSRLDSTRLMKGALDNGGFGRATDFLEQDRGLESGERIFVDGVNRVFNAMNVILISDAGRAAGAEIALASTRKRSGKRSTRKGKKRPAAKAKKLAKKSGKKKQARKSAAKKR